MNALTLVANNDDDAGCTPCTTSKISFFATGNTTYRIAVDGYHNAQGALNLHLAVPAPVNDAFANALSLSGTSSSGSGTNAAATKEAGEPNHSPVATDHGGASVWWSWTAPANGTVTIDTASSSFDTVLAAYTGSAVNALTLVANNDDENWPSILTSKVSFPTVAGTTYHLAVDGVNGTIGTISLHLALAPTPSPNDAVANAQVLVGANATRTNDSNVAATKEAGEPIHSPTPSDPGGASIWYSWTSPATASVTIDTAGSSFDTVLAAYTGAAVNALTLVANNDDAVPLTIFTSKITFAATAGTTYRIAVDGWSGLQGLVNLHLAQLTPPVVTGFSVPAQKQKKPITILGSGFTGATGVTFAKAGGGTITLNATAFTVTEDGHITATVPLLATTGHVSVTAPGGTGSSTINLKIKPTLKKFAPTSGAVGATITITGTGFTGATKVIFFSGKLATFVVVNDTKITATVPTGATTGKIQVLTPGGKATSKPVFQVL